MPLREFGRVVWRWRWLISLIAVTCAVTALLVSYQLPKKYASVSVALVNPRQPISSPGSVDSSQLPNSDQLVTTYAGLINSGPVRRRMVDLGVPRTADQLQLSIAAVPAPSSTLITITATDRDPAVALLIATTVIPAFNSSLAELQQQVQHAPSTSTLDSLVPWDVPVTAPTQPVSPNVFLNVLEALLVGLLAGIGVAFVIERLDESIATEADVRSRLGLSLLGSVRTAAARDSDDAVTAVELVTATAPANALAEAYRAIRTNIMFSRVDRPLGTIVVTSTAPAEGKTTTACNLATAMAQAGSRVILVDADFRRPSLQRIFGIPGSPGLSNLIIGEAALPGILKQADTPNLKVLVSGPHPPNPSELLGSAAMRQVLVSLSELADVVLFDTPPIGAVTDATVLASMCDGVVLVIEQRRASVQKIVHGVETLGAVGANVLGAVLNKARSERGDPDYYTYYSEAGPGTNGSAPVAVLSGAKRAAAAVVPAHGPVRPQVAAARRKATAPALAAIPAPESAPAAAAAPAPAARKPASRKKT